MSEDGRLRVHLIEAKLTHDTETFGKMDPYVKMNCREQEWKSAVCNDGGKHPTWHSQFFDIHVHYLGDDLTFKLWDDDIGKDEFIAEGSTKLSSLVHHGGFDEWFTVTYKGKDAGKLHLKGEWEPGYFTQGGHGHHHH